MPTHFHFWTKTLLLSSYRQKCLIFRYKIYQNIRKMYPKIKTVMRSARPTVFLVKIYVFCRKLTVCDYWPINNKLLSFELFEHLRVCLFKRIDWREAKTVDNFYKNTVVNFFLMIFLTDLTIYRIMKFLSLVVCFFIIT